MMRRDHSMLKDYKPYSNLFGKLVGDNLYLHRSAIYSLPKELCYELLHLDSLFFTNKWGEGYNIIKLDMRNDVISFILSSEFDTVDEPCIDVVHIIKNNKLDRVIDYRKRDKSKVPIYHHKWIMVTHGYKGFDVRSSKERTMWWTNHPVVLVRRLEDKYFKSKIGMYGYWQDLLRVMKKYDRV